MEGKEIGRGMGYKLNDLSSLEEGSTLPVGGKEVEVSDISRRSSKSSDLQWLYFESVNFMTTCLYTLRDTWI